MVLKNRAEDETQFNALPPRVSRTETYMSDAVSSIFSTFQKSAKKKLEIPRHPGGIWDIDDAMDVTESCASKIEPTGNCRPVHTVDRELFRQQLNRMEIFENSSVEFLGVEDRMDIEPRRNDSAPVEKTEGSVELADRIGTRKPARNDRASFGKSSLQTEEFNEKEIGVASEETKNFMSLNTQSEKLKKKNSQESLAERSKRSRTSSITEVYQLLPASTDETTRNEAGVSSTDGKGLSLPKHLSVQNTESQGNADFHGFAKELQNNYDAKVREVEAVKSSQKAEDVIKLYQKEIDILQRVASIFQSFTAANPPGRSGASYSVEVEQLQRICHILKQLEGSDSCLATGKNPEIPPKDVGVPGTCSDGGKILSGEAVSFLIGLEDESSCSDTHSGFKDTSKSLEFHDGSKNNKDGVPLNDDHIPNKTRTVWRRKCDDVTANSDMKSENLSKSEKVGNSKVSSDRLLNTEKESRSITQDISIMEKIMNGMLPWKPSGSPPPAVAFSGASVRISDNGTTSGMVHEPTSSPKAMDSAPSKAMGIASPLVTTVKTLPFKANEPNVVFEKLINGTLPWEPSGNAPPAVAFTGASGQISNDGTQSGIIAVSTCPSRSTDVTELQFKSMDTRMPLLPIAPPIAMDTRIPLMSIAPPIAMGAESVSKVKEQESLEHAAFLLKYNESAKLERSTALPNASSASPAKYIAPPMRNYNETQAGRINERASPLRPILPWRSSSASPRDENGPSGRTRASQWKGKDEASSWRVKNRPPFSGNGGTPRYDSNWQRGRTKDKSPTLTGDASKNNLNAAGYAHDQVVKKTNPKPYEFSQRRSEQEDKILNINQMMASESKPSEDLDAMISVKIFSEEKALVDELMVPNNELIRMKRKFPNLLEVVPSAEQEKMLELNASAVKVFLRCIFSMSYTLPSWEIALEAFALAKKFEIEKLQDACKDFFDFKPIYPGQVQDIVHIARKFQITDVLKASLMFAEVRANHIPDAAMQVAAKTPHCSVSWTTSVEPSEFEIPLCYMKEKGLGSTIESDIKNNIIFKPKSGSFCLTGFQIKFEAESRDLGKKISIFCDVFKCQERVFGEERHKPLNKMMIINFNQKLLVGPKEDVTISVLIEDVCLRLCHCLLKEKELGSCSTGSFETTFTSDKKIESKHPLFFVEKLFYTYEGRK